MEIKCVKSLYVLGDGRTRVRFEDGTTANHARLIAAIKRGRPLEKKEVAHHRNGDCSDDRLENLEALSWADHSRWHGANPRQQKLGSKARYAAIKIRLPDDLHAALKQSAVEEGRSLNSEMAIRLKRSLETYRKF